MGELAKEVLLVNIEDELKQSYLDYTISVIAGRALPDACDGLKPMHRRMLYTMSELGNDWNKPYKKSAHVVDDMIGKYRPHGNIAVCGTIVCMAQPFSLRYMPINGRSNSGSVGGDNTVAMRYTEVRMAKLAHRLLADLEKETVGWTPNCDGTEQTPAIMSTRIPNLLTNGSSGIAMGVATNIPSHNLDEVINGYLALMDNSDPTVDELMQYIPGSNFPTADITNGRAGIIEAYRTGYGRIYVRARAVVGEVERGGGREQIVITELPYQLNKAWLTEKIAELIKEGKIEGISKLRDRSDKDGMHVVIELRCGEVGGVILNNLYAQTQLQSVFGVNMVALVDGQPRTLNLKDILEVFVHHRREVVTRRTVYKLHKARKYGHILEGQAAALLNIDPVIRLIKSSPTPAKARERLIATAWESSAVEAMVEHAGTDACRPGDLDPQYGLRDGKYYLLPEQAQATLELCLHRLTGLEYEKLFSEYREILNLVGELIRILTNPVRLMEVIREELEAVKAEFGDARRTEIMASQINLTIADLITGEDRMVAISHGDYAKPQPLAAYQAQRRGDKGKSATGMKGKDYIKHLLVANNHATLLLFSSKGKIYWLRTLEIPEASRAARDRPLVNLPPLDEGKRTTAMLRTNLGALQQDGSADDDLDEAEGAVLKDEVAKAAGVEEVEGETAELMAEPTGAYIFMATTFDTVKETPLAQSSHPRSSGLITLKLEEGDTLIVAAITNGAKEVILLSSADKVIRSAESVVRIMDRNACGIHGMRLDKGQQPIFILVPESGTQILTTSERGFGRRTPLNKFPHRGHGGQEVITMVTNEYNDALIATVQVQEGEEIMLISGQGTLVRTRVDEVSLSGRNTQGVALVKLASDEVLVGLERVQKLSDGDDEDLLEGGKATESLGELAESESEPATEAEGNEE